MIKHALRSRHSVEKNEQNVLQSTQRASIFRANNTCWYCNQPLDSMRRYCDKSCAQAFEEDDSAMARRMIDTRLHMSA